jgi:c-di-GMP-binding flagellar brake protein YcgR
MSLLHFRCKERRRTLRVALTVPLTIHGKSDSGEKFSAQTVSRSVNRHGALFQLEEIVKMGQTVVLMNDHTTQSMECRVVSIHRARDGKQYVGVEFTSPETNFWHMQFPIPGARPLRRIVPNKISA